MKAELLPITLQLPHLPGRSEGVHVSNVIRCIATETGVLKPEWAEELSLVDARTITDPVSILRIAMGLAWEQWYIPQLEGVIDHPGEMQLDGIYLTHDGESLDLVLSERGIYEHVMAVHEVKLTYKSLYTVAPRLCPKPGDLIDALPQDLESQWMWITQTQAYCKALGTRYAYLHVLFTCGNYSFPIRPRLHCWKIEYSQDEIDVKWALIVDYRDMMLQSSEGAP